MTKAIGYIRVSTKQQDEEIQRNAIEKFCRERNIEVLKYFIDKGIQRSVPWRQREGILSMIKFLESGGKDIVKNIIVFDFTRLGYNLSDIFDLFNYLENELGVRVISVSDTWLQIEDEKIRKLLISIFSWLSEMELKLRKERQQAAWEMGKQKGRPKKVDDKVLIEFYNKYKHLGPLKYVYYKLIESGYSISYSRFTRRIKELRRTNLVK